jgi:hypothetical protein
MIPFQKLDFSTFKQSFINDEVSIIMNKIKEMYLFKYVYTFDEFVTYVKSSLSEHKKQLFNDFFIHQALYKLMPLTEYDVDNFTHFIYDKFNIPGYIRFVYDYYVFQPIQYDIHALMYYRTGEYLANSFTSSLSLSDFLNSKYSIDKTTEKEPHAYTFDYHYYNQRDEFMYVGIIDGVYNTYTRVLNTVFKIREKRNKEIIKKRELGLPSFKGATCLTKDKSYLCKVLTSLNIPCNLTSKEDLCETIQKWLLMNEKYSIGSKKLTYMIIPSNHAQYPFPYNLEDRMLMIQQKLKSLLSKDVIPQIQKKQINKKSTIVTYTFKVSSTSDTIQTALKDMGFKQHNNVFTYIVE